MDRKDFLKTTCAVCGVASTLAFLESCAKQNIVSFTLDLSAPANSALTRTGGYIIANNGSVIVIKTSTGYNALSLICTHNGCTVTYRGTGFYCPCHGGTFNASGAVTGGPPPTALTKYTVTVNGNILTISG